MAQNPPPFGKPISAEAAQSCMDAYTTISGTFNNQIVPNLSTANTALMAVQTFYHSGFNAFVFSKDVVMRFFENGNNAQYLMAVLGAQPKDDNANHFKKNSPTVILVGVTQDPASGKFMSLDITDPATEHPPQVALPIFPTDTGTATQLQFELL